MDNNGQSGNASLHAKPAIPQLLGTCPLDDEDVKQVIAEIAKGAEVAGLSVHDGIVHVWKLEP